MRQDQLSLVISEVHCAACHIRSKVAEDFNGRFVECSRLHAVCRTRAQLDVNWIM